MNGFLRSKLFSALAALIMIVAAIALPLTSSAIHSHAQGTITIRGFPIPTASSQPNSITSGPDGNLWFTEASGNKIGKITPSGTIIEYPVPTTCSYPFGITTGPDGNLWFTENYANQIGKITTNGSVTEYSIPTAAAAPLASPPFQMAICGSRNTKATR